MDAAAFIAEYDRVVEAEKAYHCDVADRDAAANQLSRWLSDRLADQQFFEGLDLDRLCVLVEVYNLNSRAHDRSRDHWLELAQAFAARQDDAAAAISERPQIA